jgi:hypothetical protein
MKIAELEPRAGEAAELLAVDFRRELTRDFHREVTRF